ncbi:MAG: circadian clock protein KaiB [Comamonadaceae bacterium CG_4_9_14_3_um_filter_60_33]|nr:MAG: hypothetical protein AUK51_13265 [Comamonadaceae bacterium CG2_30_59_20]PIY29677.1 MAG: circadian clock protein KaiB [Comamonadaceae bacterium CG_4_10_14_3_um_filter_60_42]PJB41160.1 MAG: circadian clock protein KaiB [Comamonadaceae bacterium CG_4_9_14_3_um_filter_60_33]
MLAALAVKAKAMQAQRIVLDALDVVMALANLTALCREYLVGRHEIEVIDVFEQPERALADAIYLTPKLVKLAPLPTKTIVGTLSHTQTVLQALGLQDRTP